MSEEYNESIGEIQWKVSEVRDGECRRNIILRLQNRNPIDGGNVDFRP